MPDALASDMLEELLQCHSAKAAELTVKLLQDQQRTITALEEKLTNQELWQRKTDKTIAELQSQLQALCAEGDGSGSLARDRVALPITQRSTRSASYSCEETAESSAEPAETAAEAAGACAGSASANSRRGSGGRQETDPLEMQRAARERHRERQRESLQAPSRTYPSPHPHTDTNPKPAGVEPHPNPSPRPNPSLQAQSRFEEYGHYALTVDTGELRYVCTVCT